DLQSESAQAMLDFLGPQRDAQQLLDLRMAQRDLLWSSRLRIRIDGAFGEPPTRRFKDDLRAPLARPIGNADGRAALEEIAVFRAQSEGFRGAPNVRRVEACAF